MPTQSLPKDFLELYEREHSSPENVNPPTQLFFRAPPSKEKLEKIPEWTATGEIVWPKGREDRPLFQKEEEELSMMKEVKLIRQNATLGNRMEAFVQGLLPVGDKEILEKAFPLSNLGGVITRYALLSEMIASELPGITAGIHGYLSQPMQPLAHLLTATPEFLSSPMSAVLWSESFPRVAAFAVQRALTWGGAKLGENIIRGVTGKDLNTKKLIWEPAEAAGFGALMGGVHGISGLWTSSAVAAGIGGGKKAIETYIKDGKLNKEDIGDILLQAGFYGMVEAIGHMQAEKMWQSKEMQDFQYNRWYARLLNQGQSAEDAKFGATLAVSNMGPAGSSLRQAAYTQIVKPNLPEQITGVQGEVAQKMANKLLKVATDPKRSLADALSKIVDNTIKENTQNLLAVSLQERISTDQEFIKYWKKAKTSAKPKIIKEADQAIAERLKSIKQAKESLDQIQAKKKPLELPVFEEYLKLPAPKSIKGLSTYNQMRYGKALENIALDNKIFTKEDIAGIKNNKSFSAYKENAMTDKEAAKAISIIEDAIEIDSEFEGPQYKKTLQTVDKLRRDYLGAKEKGVFDDVLRMAMPDELKSEIGKDWTFIDWIRPSWRVFRKDPVMNQYGQQPISDAYAMKERFIATAIKEARAKVKELGLTPEDLRQVTIKRHTDYSITQGQKDLKPVVLNDRQAKWDDWLTKQFEGLHSFFKLDRMIPFHMYMPYITETDKIDQGILSEIYPEYMPKNITAFFEKRRQTKDLLQDKFRENSLDLYEMYLRAGAKKRYMLPALRTARRHVIENPNIAANLKSHFQDWGTWMLGYPSLADHSLTALFENRGLKGENAQRVARFMMDLTYMGGIGLRPMSAIRNGFQDLNTACELGYKWTAAGWIDFLINGGRKHAREMGVLMDYAPELYSELGKYTPMMKLRDASLFMFRIADEKNRSIAYYAAENKFQHFYDKYGDSDKFFQKSGINFTDKPKRAQIKDLVHKGEIDKAKHEFGKEIVAKTQYLYNKESSPLINKTVGGKLLFQFKSWPENYGELITDWVRNKNYAAAARVVMGYMALGIAGEQLGQKWMAKTVPVGSLPVEQWKFERALVPAAIGPVADLLFLFTEPGMIGLTEQDPDAMAKKFEQRLKILGKDVLLYIPGGLAMKDFFKIKTIPTFSLFENENVPQNQPGNIGQFKFKPAKQGAIRFKTKKIMTKVDNKI